MAYHIGPDLSAASQLFSNATVAATVAAYMNNILVGAGGGTTRALVAMAQTSTPWNSDDFNGFGVERAKILNMVKTDSNNPILLGGDLHDSWAWTMYEGGNKSGIPMLLY
jgi:phosphodiesterase/alkaline phosphatase D-like protein